MDWKDLFQDYRDFFELGFDVRDLKLRLLQIAVDIIEENLKGIQFVTLSLSKGELRRRIFMNQTTLLLFYFACDAPFIVR